MRVIFMGTPAYAVPALKALIASEHEVVAVYTQPDREQGRGKKLVFSPVKEAAVEASIPVFQPLKVRKREVVEEIRGLKADVIVVAAFGQIIPDSILSMTKYGCINIHASLLPAYRGAAPINWAIIDGCEKTGITIMQMDSGIDTGDILLQAETEIRPDDTGDTLEARLSEMGGPLILQALSDAEQGKLRPVKQPEISTTDYAKKLEKTMGLLDFNEDAFTLERKIRAFDSWPSCYAYLNGKMLKIYKAAACEAEDGEHGRIVSVTKKDFTVQCRDSRLTILEVQAEGKKRMAADAYLRGVTLREGEAFAE